MRVSVRTRLALGNVALLALALLAFAVATRFVIGRVLWGRLDEMLVQQAEQDTLRRGQRNDRPGFPGLSPGFDGPPPGAPRPQPGELGLLLRPRHWNFDNNDTPDQAPWSPESLRMAQKGEAVFGRGEEEGRTLRTYTLPVRESDGRVFGAVQTAIPVGPTEAALASVTYSLVLLLPVLCLVAGLGGLWLTSRALTPIRQLTDVASKIEAENLAERLPEPGGNDELDQLTKMLNRSLSQLDEAFKRQKQFTSHASHELRTPLATIKTALGLLQRTDLPTPLRAEAIASADDATNRASRLVTDLLFLSRSQRGEFPVRRTEVQVAEALRTAVAAPATLEVLPELTFTTDRDLLMRLVSNLVSNALRHTPPEGKVTVNATRKGATLVITVSDTGAGIAPEHLERLGQPFYRPDTARTRDDGGVGLGLSICHAIARSLRGGLTIESEPGKGTKVTASLR